MSPGPLGDEFILIIPLLVPQSKPKCCKCHSNEWNLQRFDCWWTIPLDRYIKLLTSHCFSSLFIFSVLIFPYPLSCRMSPAIKTLSPCRSNIGPPSSTLSQHWSNMWWTFYVLPGTTSDIVLSCHGGTHVLVCLYRPCIPANTRWWTNADLMLAQRRRRWANI